MLKILSSDEKKFKNKLEKILSNRINFNKNIIKNVSKIISDIEKSGDSALRKYTLEYDNFDISKNGLVIETKEIDNAYNSCDKDLISALKLAKKRIYNFHSKQLPKNFSYYDKEKILLGSRWTPLESVGLYAPGGSAAYPSSVLMLTIPAKVAKVKNISLCAPCPNGYINKSVLAAAKIAKVDRIYKVGGAQAIAALAIGTNSISPVNKIFGPGNDWVTEAKRQLFGRVGIDMIAGPSEILIIADAKNNAEWIAADLLSQAEHDVSSQSILITDKKNFAKKVLKNINQILKVLPRKNIAKNSWINNGIVILVRNLTEAAEITNIIAPEHLQISTENPKNLSKNITNAGAIFFGRYTPEAVGDYIAGPNHVLPTYRSAKFSSGLSTQDFMKRTSLIQMSKGSFSKISSAAIKIAEFEGLNAHALSLKLRNKN